MAPSTPRSANAYVCSLAFLHLWRVLQVANLGLDLGRCETCRKRKVKCTGEKPCRACVKHNLQCIFGTTGRRKYSEAEVKQLLDKIRIYEERLASGAEG